MNRMAIALLTALVFSASACGGTVQSPGGGAQPSGGASTADGGPTAQSTGSGGGTKPDPCSLLSPDDLKAQIGVPFQPGVLVGTDECDWVKVGSTARISLTIKDIGSDGWGCIPGGQPVPGVGDEACFDGGNGLLHVRHGSWDLVFLRTESVTKDQIIGIAKVAASHL